MHTRKRVKAADALSHPFVSTYHDPEDEPFSEKPLDWSFMSSELSPDLWKTLTYSEILDFHQNPSAASAHTPVMTDCSDFFSRV
ncbi:mitogen-activated protein kinase HOG1 [Penicillium sp. IBT 35674x]|nr:mitogen-activated protein kinase HOG1 [Penicillium sp. IBT 35674x]